MKSNAMGIFVNNLFKKKSHNTFYAAVQESVDWLKPFLFEILQQDSKKSNATTEFVSDLDKIIVEHKIQEKYETKSQDVYLNWLKMLDPKLDQPTKEKLCEELLQRSIDGLKNTTQDKIPVVNELCFLPPIVVAPILLYSPLKILSTYYSQQKKYARYSSDIEDENFKTTLEFVIKNPNIFPREAITLFLNKITDMLKQLAKETHFSSDETDSLLHEAIACWEKKLPLTLLTKHFDQALQVEYAKFKETVQKKLENPIGNLSLQNQIDSLVFEKLLVEYHYSPERLTPIVIRFNNDDDLHELSAIYAAHKLDKFTMFKHHLLELAKDTNSPNHYEFSSLFFSACLKSLKENAKSIVPELATFLSAEYYAKHSYPFSPIRKELFAFWIEHKPDQISSIVKAVLALPKSQHQTPAEHFFFELSYAELPDSFYDKLSILLSDKLTIDEFINFYSAVSEKIQQKLLGALLRDKNTAVTNLKNLCATYKAGNFSAIFLRNVSKQLTSMDPKLYQEVETLKLFQEEVKDDLEADLQLLAKILANESLTHDERRSEIRKLSNLHDGLADKSTGTCPVVLKMFKSVPQQYWSDLFAYFDSEIIHWSFPMDENHLELFYPDKDKRPAPRKNTWLDFKADWERILYDTLVAILPDLSKDDLRGDVANWALADLDKAFNKSEAYFPGMAENILKKFFLNNAPNSIKVFKALHDKFTDKYHPLAYFSRENIYNQVASWLPEDSASRPIFLANLLKFDNRFEELLRTPFIRNKYDIASVAFALITTRTEHIVNFIQKFRGGIGNILFKTLYQYEKEQLLALMQTALSDLNKASLTKETFLQLAEMVLILSENAKMDIFQIIDADENKDLFINLLLDADTTEKIASFYPPYQLIFSIVQHYQPEQLQNLIIQHIQRNIQKDDLFVLCECIDAGEKVTGNQLILPEAIEKSLREYLTNKIPQMSYPSYSEIKLMAQFIPNFDCLFLTSKAKELSLRNALSSTQKEYLDHLVKVYGFASVNTTCSDLKMNECSRYLVEKFSKFPDIFQQIDKAIQSYDLFFEEHSHEIDDITISIFNRNLSSAITEAAMHSNTIPINVNIAEVCKQSKISPELAALMPDLRIKENEAEVKSQKVLSWTNIWSKGEVIRSQPSNINTSSMEISQPRPN